MKQWLAALTLLLVGCATPRAFQEASAGSAGCRPEEIGIENVNQGLFTITTWEALCRGDRYVCTGAGVVNCKKLQ